MLGNLTKTFLGGVAALGVNVTKVPDAHGQTSQPSSVEIQNNNKDERKGKVQEIVNILQIELANPENSKTGNFFVEEGGVTIVRGGSLGNGKYPLYYNYSKFYNKENNSDFRLTLDFSANLELIGGSCIYKADNESKMIFINSDYSLSLVRNQVGSPETKQDHEIFMKCFPVATS